MLKQRLLTALVALPLFLYFLVHSPQWGVAIFILICVAVTNMEISAMTLLSPSGLQGHDRYYVWNCAALGSAIFFAYCFSEHAVAIIPAALIYAIILPVFLSPTIAASVNRSLGTVFALIYGTLPWIAVWEIYKLGLGYLILLLAVVWLGDTGGYFGGRYFGRTPLSPHKSPKKTWEGAGVGLLASIAAALVTRHVFPEIGSAALVVFTAALGGILGQLGDLVESTFKRHAGIKDSGMIFPGHGGFLDRVDGVIFAAPAVWLVLSLAMERLTP